MRCVGVMAAMVVLLVSLISFDTISAGEKKWKVGVLLPGSVEFFQVQRVGMDKAGMEFGVDIAYADAEWDPGKQLSQVEDFIAQQVDAVVLCPTDNMALLPAVDKCREAGIPLITHTMSLGPDPEGRLDGVVSFIGINDYTRGLLMGEMAAKLLGDRSAANIVVIEGTPGTPGQRMRTAGYNKFLESRPGWKVIYSQAVTGWTKEGALSVIEAFLRTGQEVDLISCQWHSAATAVADALAEAELGHKVFVTGLELSREIVPYIKRGAVDMTSDVSISGLGFEIIRSTSLYLNGTPIPNVIEVKDIIVDKGNIDNVVPEL